MIHSTFRTIDTINNVAKCDAINAVCTFVFMIDTEKKNLF